MSQGKIGNSNGIAQHCLDEMAIILKVIFLDHSIKFEYVNIILFAFLLFKIENVFDFTRGWDLIKSETMSQGK